MRKVEESLEKPKPKRIKFCGKVKLKDWPKKTSAFSKS